MSSTTVHQGIILVSHKCPAFGKPIMAVNLSLAFLGNNPRTPLGKFWQHEGNSAFFNKNFPEVRDIVWFLCQTCQIPKMHQLDMFYIGQHYVTFKISDECVDEQPCFHLYDISWRSSVFVRCLFFIMLLSTAWDLIQRKAKGCNCQ